MIQMSPPELCSGAGQPARPGAAFFIPAHHQRAGKAAGTGEMFRPFLRRVLAEGRCNALLFLPTSPVQGVSEEPADSLVLLSWHSPVAPDQQVSPTRVSS